MAAGGGQVDFKPLYAQVREDIIRRLADGQWQPGSMLPSEQELGRLLGVSQGTVRKALDSLASERILVRRQGRGTFVAEFEESRILFQFFRLFPNTGDRLFPMSKVLSCTRETATQAERDALGLGGAKVQVWRIERVRYFDSDPILVETICLPVERFPDFGDLPEIPNNVYQLYSKNYAISVARSSEKVTAVAATAHEAKHLVCPEGQPLLAIARLAYDVTDRPVEYRNSYCLTERVFYSPDV